MAPFLHRRDCGSQKVLSIKKEKILELSSIHLVKARWSMVDGLVDLHQHGRDYSDDVLSEWPAQDLTQNIGQYINKANSMKLPFCVRSLDRVGYTWRIVDLPASSEISLCSFMSLSSDPGSMTMGILLLETVTRTS
jgi:hypothetical protein